jgi:phosphate transport system substrate-binding protein
MKKHLMSKTTAGIITIIALTFFGCDPNAGLKEETATRGKIKIGIDESFSLLGDAELYTFQSIYTNAHITPIYKPELDILDEFLNDSVRLIITTRKLTEKELSYLKGKLSFPVTSSIAYDAVGFIVNPKNNDTSIRYDIINDIFRGKVNKWNQIDQKNNAGKIKVVFDNLKSANVRYIKETFKIDSFPKNCYVANKNEEVINYVEKHINALGVISVNWISDSSDSVTRDFLKRVKVVGVTPKYDPISEDFYKPYQAYIADKSYPFIREVYVINRESFTGLGSGFIAFISADQGQRIVLKMGMVPATMPVRLVKVKNKY